jgi:CRISPR-associated protein Csb1
VDVGDRGYGLGENATQLVIALSLWKVRKFLDSTMRLRTACELELVDGEKSINVKRPAGFALPSDDDLSQLIKKCDSLFANHFSTRVPAPGNLVAVDQEMRFPLR